MEGKARARTSHEPPSARCLLRPASRRRYADGDGARPSAADDLRAVVRRHAMPLRRRVQQARPAGAAELLPRLLRPKDGVPRALQAAADDEAYAVSEAEEMPLVAWKRGTRSSRFPTALGRSPLTSAPGGPDCAAMKSLRSVAVAAALLAACSQPSAPQGPAEVQLSTDLNPGMVDAALTMIARSGGPRGERIAGMHAGVSALPGAAGAPVPGAEQTPKPAESGAVRWDSEPFGT